MVSVKKKVIKNQTYFYLEHTIREDGKPQKKEKYLGKSIPKNIEEIKKEFLSEIYKEKWYPLFDKIKENYSKEKSSMPKTAKEKQIHNFSIQFTYDTNKIEGSKLTLRETADLLERGLTPRAKPLDDIKEAEAHKNVFYEILNYKKDISLQAILYWHKKIFENTKTDIAGNLRQHQVAISGSKFMPPLAVEIYPLMNDFFKWYNKNKDKLNPIELSALVHLKVVTIHPFADGNGRITRLLMNFVLRKYKYPLLSIHYENRTSYYNALERAQTKNQENIFVQWVFKRYVKEHNVYLR